MSFQQVLAESARGRVYFQEHSSPDETSQMASAERDSLCIFRRITGLLVHLAVRAAHHRVGHCSERIST